MRDLVGKITSWTARREKGQKGSRYWSVNSVGEPGLRRLHGFALCQQVALGYIASLRDVAEAKKGLTPPWVHVASAGGPELHRLIEGCS